MAYKFIKATRAKEWNGVQIVIDGSPVWAECSKQVKDYAGNNFAEGDDVEFEYVKEDGKIKIEGHIKKVGGSSEEASSYSSPSSEFACSDCGASLKDGKYKKCYTCNQKSPSTPKSSGGSRYNDPDVQASIKRQAIGNMTSRTLIALQGQVTVNEIHEVAEEIYKTYQRLVG